MNRLDALRIFCAAAQTRNFRQTALSLGISPQAVTRAVAFLEREFGGALFVRNTRTTQISPFGEQVYREARTALSHTENLFQRFSLHERTAEHGLVRVDSPLVDEFGLLDGVLHRLRARPDIVLDWRSGNQYSNTDREQIDVGVRVGVVQGDDLIVKPIGPLQLQTVMAPALAERLGTPNDIDDLRTRFPLLGMADANTGRLFTWDYPEISFAPEAPAFVSHQTSAALAAVRQARAVGQFAAWMVRDDLRAGRLLHVLADQDMTLDWQLYVYRPGRHQQTARVRIVFDALVDTLEAWFSGASVEVPNHKTREARDELRAGKGKRSADADALFRDLDI